MKAYRTKIRLSALTAVAALGTLMGLASLSSTAVGDSQRPPGIGLAQRPDLLIPAVQKVYMWNGIQRDQLWVKIANQGQAPVSNYGMKFQWGQGLGDQQHFFQFLGSLAPGEYMWVKVDADGYDLSRPGCRFRLEIDHTHSIAESNEDNNTYDGP